MQAVWMKLLGRSTFNAILEMACRWRFFSVFVVGLVEMDWVHS